MAREVRDYKSMMDELQALLSDMQTEELDVDMALKKYERGQKLIAELGKYLESAENKVVKHTVPKGGEAK